MIALISGGYNCRRDSRGAESIVIMRHQYDEEPCKYQIELIL